MCDHILSGLPFCKILNTDCYYRPETDLVCILYRYLDKARHNIQNIYVRIPGYFCMVDYIFDGRIFRYIIWNIWNVDTARRTVVYTVYMVDYICWYTFYGHKRKYMVCCKVCNVDNCNRCIYVHIVAPFRIFFGIFCGSSRPGIQCTDAYKYGHRKAVFGILKYILKDVQLYNIQFQSNVHRVIFAKRDDNIKVYHSYLSGFLTYRFYRLLVSYYTGYLLCGYMTDKYMELLHCIAKLNLPFPLWIPNM